MKYLHFYTTLVSNTLANEQSMIIRIYGNNLVKTNSYIFLLTKMFKKLYITKPKTSSFLSNEKFLIGVEFKKEFGK